MEVKVLFENGYEAALFGIGLSFGLTSGKDISIISEDNELRTKLHNVAKRISVIGGGENKFLRQISVIIDLKTSFAHFKQFDTYKVGTTAQSESSMHTILKNEITEDMFDMDYQSEEGREFLRNTIIPFLNERRKSYMSLENDLSLSEEERKEKRKEIWYDIIDVLPSSWYQRRIVTLNYAVIQNIISKRWNHKLYQWKEFCEEVMKQVKHPDLITGGGKLKID